MSNSPSSMKTSKAALLMKGGDYLQQLKADRDNVGDKATALKRRIDALNLELGELMSMMPASTSLKIAGKFPIPLN